MKSALELAMERAGKMAGETKSLSDEQKEKIAETRKIAEAKVAEAKIMLDDKISKVSGSEAYAEVIGEAKKEFFAEKSRIERDAETAIEKIRNES